MENPDLFLYLFVRIAGGLFVTIGLISCIALYLGKRSSKRAKHQKRVQRIEEEKRITRINRVPKTRMWHCVDGEWKEIVNGCVLGLNKRIP